MYDKIKLLAVYLQGKWTNKQRVLVFCSRGISHRWDRRRQDNENLKQENMIVVLFFDFIFFIAYMRFRLYMAWVYLCFTECFMVELNVFLVSLNILVDFRKLVSYVFHFMWCDNYFDFKFILYCKKFLISTCTMYIFFKFSQSKASYAGYTDIVTPLKIWYRHMIFMILW